MSRSTLVVSVFAALVSLGCSGLFSAKPYLPSSRVMSSLHGPGQVILWAPTDSPEARAFRPYLEHLRGTGLDARVLDRTAEPDQVPAVGAPPDGTLAFTRNGQTVDLLVGNTPGTICQVLPVLDDDLLAIRDHLERARCEVAILSGDAGTSSADPGDPHSLRALATGVDQMRHPVQPVKPADLAATRACVVVARGPQPADAQAALRAWLAKGGSALLLVGPEGGLPLDAVGVGAGTAPLADVKAHARSKGDATDQHLIATNQIASHPIFHEFPRGAAILLPDAVALDPGHPAAGGGPAVLLRAMPSTWVDTDGDLRQEKGEPSGSLPVALAVHTPAGGRVVVIGSADAFSARALGTAAANPYLLYGVMHWLFGDDSGGFSPASPARVKACKRRIR